jgi:hypothetical protein
MRIYLAMSPFDQRVLAQTRPIHRPTDLPRGAGGEGWAMRETDVDDRLFETLLHAQMSGDEMDRLHREWWDQARREGDPLWPDL